MFDYTGTLSGKTGVVWQHKRRLAAQASYGTQASLFEQSLRLTEAVVASTGVSRAHWQTMSVRVPSVNSPVESP